MKKLIVLVFAALISVSFYADARLVSGTAQHRHDSATGGGDLLSSNTKIAPSIFAYDSTAPANEKYWKFGNAGGDFILLTYDDAQVPVQTAFTITRTGTTTNEMTITPSVTFSGTVSSTKPCASGFTRITPNFCHRDAGSGFVSLVRDVCTTLTSGISDATALYIEVEVFASAAAVAGVRRFSRVGSYSENTCSNLYDIAIGSVWEFSAVAAGVTLHESATFLITRGATAYLQFIDDEGNQGAAVYKVLGYYD